MSACLSVPRRLFSTASRLLSTCFVELIKDFGHDLFFHVFQIIVAYVEDFADARSEKKLDTRSFISLASKAALCLLEVAAQPTL